MSKLKKYLISDPKYYSSNPKSFKTSLEDSLRKHNVDIACFRDKSSKNFEELANIFLKVCKEFKVEKVLINSNIDLAKKLGFDGVHLNSKQFDKIEFSKSLNLITGISCHTFEELQTALVNGIDFVSYSPIFNTPNKGEALGINNLIKATTTFKNLKIIALGGIISNEQIEEISKTNAYGFASIRYFI